MLVKVLNKETGEAVSMGLQESMTLDKVRDKLFSTGIMKDDIMFLYDGAKVFRESETEILLGEILGGGHELLLGKNGDINQTFNVSDFTSLTNGEVLDFFKKKQLCRGIIFSASAGIRKSFSDTFTLTKIPDTLAETQNTWSKSSYFFSKEAWDIGLLSSDHSSVALNTPYVNAKAGYDFQKKENTHKETVTEYLLTEFVVSLMSFKINPKDCLPTEAFVQRMNGIISSNAEDERKIVEVLKALEEFGLYIPLEFTMGGALYGMEETEITEFSHAEKEKKDFTASVNAGFGGYGGMIDFSEDKEQDTGSSSSEKYKNVEIKQIGGIAGNTDSKELFKASLEKLANWAIVDIKQFYPSVMLLSKAPGIKNVDPMLFIKTQKLLSDFCMHSYVLNYQPYVDMGKYVDRIYALSRPF